MDDERFIGSNGFWQNEQSFDAARVNWPILSQSSINFGHISKALRIFGRNAKRNLSLTDTNYITNSGVRPTTHLGEHRLNTNFIWANINEWDYHKLKLFAYDYKNLDAAKLSNQTSGIIHQFKFRPNLLTYRTELIAAYQVRHEINTKPTTHFYRIEAAIQLQGLEFSIRQEKLTSTISHGKHYSFITPLASLHDHQGWTDRFTVTPSEGLIDTSVRLLWKARPWRIKARFHSFQADQSTNQSGIRIGGLGTEYNMELEYRITQDHDLQLRIANFHAQGHFKTIYHDATRIILTHSILF